MTTVYQLSRQACPPCQMLKRKVNELKDKSFNYVYVDVDNPDAIAKGSINEEIYLKAHRQGIRMLPIVGITVLKDGVETLQTVLNVNSKSIDGFIEYINK